VAWLIPVLFLNEEGGNVEDDVACAGISVGICLFPVLLIADNGEYDTFGPVCRAGVGVFPFHVLLAEKDGADVGYCAWSMPNRFSTV
jgi:hypothetical protein